MSSSSHAAALAAFQGIGNKSKSEILHDKKNPQKFKIPTESSRVQSLNTGNGNPGSSLGPTQMVRRTSTTTSQFKKPNVVAKASTTGQLKSTPKLHIDLNSIGKATPSTLHLPKGALPMHPNPLKLPQSHQQLQRSDTTSTASLALAAATVSAGNNNNTYNTNTADYPPSTPKGINYHRSIPASSSVSVYSQDSSSIDYFNIQSNPNYNTNSTPAQNHQLQLKKSSSQHSNLSTNDMIQKVKKSIESRMVNSDNKLPKANSSSLDMINQIKNSINSKSKAASQSTTELSQRNQDRLNEIRDTIDMKRIHTPRVTSIDPSNSSFVGPPTSSPLASTPLLSPIASHRNGSGSASISGSSSPVLAPRGPGDFERNAFHNSYSSIGSSIHSSGSELVSILANQQGRVSTEKIQESPMKENAPTIMVDNNEGEPVIVQSLGLLPGLVPGLVGELLNNLAVLLNEQQNSKAAPMKPAGLEESNQYSYFNDLASMMLTVTENDKRVPRRKPPPISQEDFESGTTDYASDLPSLNLNKPFILPDVSSGRQLFEEVNKNAHYQQDDSSTTKFPQFPGLSQHKKNKSKSNIHMKESDYKDNESEEDETSEFETEQPNPVMLETHGSRQQIVKPVQKVQLKTTMRKTNKRKEKKLTFNENKPWKNHTDLSYITEQERKRYEGVWVSNKGLYLSSVVTKLVGVDYGSDLETAQETTPLTKEETSLAAARLSSKLREETNLEDNFHNQTSAELSQLIHGVVVKRIWLRSRLPMETLKGIWALVDFRHDGTLNKAEFIAGMWFVDQCLYGRKLPKKVDAAVWDSLGSIGLNVVVKKKGRR